MLISNCNAMDGACGGHFHDKREAVRFDYVSISFHTRDGSAVLAVDDVNLSVRQNEFIALVGPSGCGKSTLLRSVAGLVEPSKGQVRVNSPEGLKGFARVAVVFQAATLLPWKTVLGNLLYPVRFGTRKPDVDYTARAHSLLEMVGLERFANAYPNELSGGMQQRVAICRSLTLDPDILLMDEPFSALDALTREELQFELRRIQQATGKTILFVTHSMSESVLLADRIVVMAAHPGRVKDDFMVDLPAERDQSTLDLSAFSNYVRRVREGIYGQSGGANR
jgi:NitT/TauT family transport system ATP-binding protein